MDIIKKAQSILSKCQGLSSYKMHVLSKKGKLKHIIFMLENEVKLNNIMKQPERSGAKRNIL